MIVNKVYEEMKEDTKRKQKPYLTQKAKYLVWIGLIFLHQIRWGFKNCDVKSGYDLEKCEGL